MKVWRDVPQNIHFKDCWSRTFCNVGGSVSSAIEVYCITDDRVVVSETGL